MSEASVPPSVPPLHQRWSLVALTRLAAITGIAALLIMMYAVLVPRPLPVILSMSVAQALGAFALACHVLAILADVSRRRSPPDQHAPPGPAD